MVIDDHDPYRGNPLLAENQRLEAERDKLRGLLAVAVERNDILEAGLTKAVRGAEELMRENAKLSDLLRGRDPRSEDDLRAVRRTVNRILLAVVVVGGMVLEGSMIRFLLRLW